ncbi:hypothetical protein [Noviherbaspirillum sp. Root189]|uniref:hypothetical protein n=1 Tax=Noviherbaspirillum sp. Root189 TaxID=1736487 RepID=UPI00070DCF3F|nr:hypothetical protein [Noviherbaspirillum sp. Root189]KRB79210.1 hypothetical protein ASE07_05940 [Noviherbaspirillum sp. Root189]
MKTLLIMLLVSLSVIGWRRPDILQAIGMAGAAQDPATLATGNSAATQLKKLNVDTLIVQAPDNGKKPMSAAEFTELAKKDTQAYQKFIGSLRIEEERSEVDKLLNFFARGKYE